GPFHRPVERHHQLGHAVVQAVQRCDPAGPAGLDLEREADGPARGVHDDPVGQSLGGHPPRPQQGQQSCNPPATHRHSRVDGHGALLGPTVMYALLHVRPIPRSPLMAGLLDRERIIAQPGFNRWLVPPAALAIHLSIGMAYGFSVFWLPLSRAIGVYQPVPCGPEVGFFAQLVTTTCDWKISMLGWMYSLFFFFLGSSAAIFGGWLEKVGPRRAGVVAAFCWGGGFFISAIGIKTHQLWLMWLGSGVIGGCGLGLGYISPVSTLIKWFPDRRGMATGMAIMGFGGGALIGSPLADMLMKRFASATSVGAFETFLTMGSLYFAAMLLGAFGYRIPRPDWKPAGWVPKVQRSE